MQSQLQKTYHGGLLVGGMPGMQLIHDVKKIFLFLILLSSPAFAQHEPRDLFEAGVAKYKQGAYEEAINLFTESLSMAPDNAKVFKNRGVAFMSLRKMDDAISDFENALRINPELKGLYSNLGAAWHYKGEYEKAITNYDIAIKEDPNNYIVYFNRAISRVALKQLKEGLADFDKTLELKPQFEPAILARRDVQKMLDETRPEKYALQTGAFLKEENAIEMRNGLNEKGVDARILVLKDSKGRTWYLVRYSGNLDRNEAESLKHRLERQRGVHSIIRPEHSF